MAKFSKKQTYSLILIMLLPLLIMVYKDVLASYVVKQSLNCHGKNSDMLRDIALFAISEYQYPTIQIAYMDNANNLSTCVAGWERTWFFSKKVDNTTHYTYASLTKIFISDKILALIRNHQLTLDSKLVDNLVLKNHDFTDDRVKTINIANLLSHRAGFDRDISGDVMFASKPWCPYNIEMITTVELDFNPNQRKAYSNLGYCLLSQVITYHEQKEFITSIEDTYHLKQSDIHFIQHTLAQLPKIPLINSINSERYGQIASLDFYALSADGGLYGSAMALVKQLNRLEKIKTPNITQRSPNIPDCNTKQIDGCHGYMGYEYSVNPRLRFYWRSGSLPTTTAFAVMDNKGGSLVFLTNYRDDNDSINQINFLIKKIYDTRLSKTK